MDNKNLDARIKAADPATEVELGAELLHAATKQKPQRFGTAAKLGTAIRTRFLITALAAAGALALAIPLTIAPGEPEYLLSISGSQDSSGLAAKDAPGAEAQVGVRDMAMWAQFNYLAGSSLSTETGLGVAYQAKLSGTPEEYLSMLGKAFGISGNPRESQYSSPEWPTWVLGPEDGSGPNIYLNWTGTGSWWFNDPSAWPSVKTPTTCEGVAAPDGEDAQIDPACPYTFDSPEENSNIPSETELIAQARQIFTSVGVSFSPDQLRVSRDTWGASLEASMLLDGNPTAEMWWMNWSESGQLAGVSGFAAEFQEIGFYDLVSQKSAVTRLSDYRYSGAVAFKFYNSENALPIAEGPVARDLEAEPMPEPEIIELIIDSAKQVNVTVWAADNSVWILPGYAYYADGAFAGSVFALEDGLVKLPALEVVK